MVFLSVVLKLNVLIPVNLVKDLFFPKIYDRILYFVVTSWSVENIKYHLFFYCKNESPFDICMIKFSTCLGLQLSVSSRNQSRLSTPHYSVYSVCKDFHFRVSLKLFGHQANELCPA